MYPGRQGAVSSTRYIRCYVYRFWDVCTNTWIGILRTSEPALWLQAIEYVLDCGYDMSTRWLASGTATGHRHVRNLLDEVPFGRRIQWSRHVDVVNHHISIYDYSDTIRYFLKWPIRTCPHCHLKRHLRVRGPRQGESCSQIGVCYLCAGEDLAAFAGADRSVNVSVRYIMDANEAIEMWGSSIHRPADESYEELMFSVNDRY